MRILFVCPDAPYPPRAGGSLRIVNLARSLARYTSITLLTYVVSPAEIDALTEFSRQYGIQVRSVQRPARRNTLTRARHKLCHYYGSYLFSSLPGPVRFNAQPVMRHALLAALNDDGADVIIWDYWFMAEFAALARDIIPAALHIADAIDLEWLRLQRQAQVSHGLTRLWATYIQPSVRRYTLDRYQRMDGVIFLSRTDLHLARRELPDFTRLSVVPMGLMLDEYPAPIAPPQPDRVLFFGSFRHQPNVDALRFLLHDIWPRIQQARPQATLDLMGSDMPEWASDAVQQSSNIRILGFQAGIHPVLAEASVVIAPLRFGSGVKIKILEAMASGKAVVTTSIGAEGIEAEAGTDFIVADDALALASEVIRLLDSPALCERIGQRARQFIRTHHDADEIARDFLARLNEIGVKREPLQ